METSCEPSLILLINISPEVDGRYPVKSMLILKSTAVFASILRADCAELEV